MCAAQFTGASASTAHNILLIHNSNLRKLQCPVEEEGEFFLCAVCMTAVDLKGARDAFVYFKDQPDEIFWLQVYCNMHHTAVLEVGGALALVYT